MNIGIYIYEQAEVLDFAGPFEVFSTAKRLGADSINVFFVAEQEKVVSARGGFKVIADYTIADHPTIDLLMVVGGVHTAEMNKANVTSWLNSTALDAAHVACVCTGVFILAKTGLLAGATVTTHWEDIADLTLKFPELTVISDNRWVSWRKYTTSGGISAGIDMSLHLVSKLFGEQQAIMVAKQMEYHWQR